MWLERSVRVTPLPPGIPSAEADGPKAGASRQDTDAGRASALGPLPLTRKVCGPHLRGRGRAEGPERGREGRRAADLPRPAQAHLRSVSRAPSCLSNGRPSAARRSLLSSSAARQYWACSSPPLGYICCMNFTSGLARSTSEVFFSCTEMNVAMASASTAFRAQQTALQLKGRRGRQTGLADGRTNGLTDVLAGASGPATSGRPCAGALAVPPAVT